MGANRRELVYWSFQVNMLAASASGHRNHKQQDLDITSCTYYSVKKKKEIQVHTIETVQKNLRKMVIILLGIRILIIPQAHVIP